MLLRGGESHDRNGQSMRWGLGASGAWRVGMAAPEAIRGERLGRKG